MSHLTAFSCRLPRLAITILAALPAALASRPAAAAPVRHTLRLYREDPRPAGDLPAGIGPAWQPTARRPAARRRISRRAQRRAGRRDSWETDAPRFSHFAEPALAIPVEPHSGLQIQHRNIGYPGGSDHHRFDLALPGGCRKGPIPLVVWLPGDDWAAVDRGSCPITWLTGHGYAVASVGYRPSSDCRFPGQWDDCLAAIGQLVADASLWNIDPDRIVVVGRAGGGHLAALLGLAQAGITAADAGPPGSVPTISAVCSISPVTSLATLGDGHSRLSAAASRLIGGPLAELREAALAASPLSYVSADDPPVLLVHDRSGRLVPLSQSERLHQTLQRAGVESRLVIGDETGSLGENDRVGRLLLEFLDEKISGPARNIAVDEPPTRRGEG